MSLQNLAEQELAQLYRCTMIAMVLRSCWCCGEIVARMKFEPVGGAGANYGMTSMSRQTSNVWELNIQWKEMSCRFEE